MLTPDEVIATGRFIAHLQSADGALPHFVGGEWDAWNHTEALMGLSVAGVVAKHSDELPGEKLSDSGATNPSLTTGGGAPEQSDGTPANSRARCAVSRELLDHARRGLDYLAATQRPDGSWPMKVTDGVVELTEADTNQCAYPAVGVWHLALATCTADGINTELLTTYWPMVRDSLTFVLQTQLPEGHVAWAINERGGLGEHALLTGCASILQSLWAGIAIASALGHEAEAAIWARAGNRLAEAICTRPELFIDRYRYSMDWFYPVLGGAIAGDAAERHMSDHTHRFFWPGYGIRCVDDHPWVTGGESAEYVMALMCLADQPDGARHRAQAAETLEHLARLRTDDGAYWTGYVVPDSAIWPEEQTGWTAGAVLLAEDAVFGLTPASNFFHAMTWPVNRSFNRPDTSPHVRTSTRSTS